MIDNSDYLNGLHDAEIVAQDIYISIGPKYVKSCLTSEYEALITYYKDVGYEYKQYLKGFRDYLDHFIKNENFIIDSFRRSC